MKNRRWGGQTRASVPTVWYYIQQNKLLFYTSTYQLVNST
ncbi:hypothetical protein HMPREF0973_02165 [Prevotella veroralis F0319]|uniref:Uncharacterized protein n=1 Tax=Prevotella veroralis F0319 TaxID=649761 RepID=C9MRB3_9BACT|nr:hypothetical protein HMPREF0973_02165 [Prevotella veroralis F0319]